jgi:beta-lactamase regulating signal transducer with metallopeptidase domain
VTELILTEPVVESIGWALVHFVWQGALIGLGTAAVLGLTRTASAATRYAVSCAGLALMLAAPVVTSVRSAGARDPIPAVAVTEREATPAAAVPAPARRAPAAEASAAAAPARAYVERALPIAVSLWLAGVLCLSLRLAGGWYRVERLRRRSTQAVSETVEGRVAILAGRLRVRRVVRVVQSAAVTVPTLVGWIRPVILLPASVIAGLPTHHLDAVIAHELAHVRRHDYLVNALQAVVETLLFYHPAVWWCSRRIRIEREHCCDDLAVSACGDRVAYATALANLEDLRRDANRLALAATDGHLLSRVRRVLGVAPAHDGRSHLWAAAATLALVAILALGSGTLTRADGQDAAPVLPLPPVPPSAPAAPAPPAAPQPPASPQVAAPPAAPAPPAPPAQRDISHISWSDSSERITLSHRGTITLNDDDTDIVSLSPYGYFIVTESASWVPRFLSTWVGIRREIELRGRPDGTIARIYVSGGREQAYEPEGREWLREMLPAIVRRTGLAADTRVARILQRDGVAGIAREMALLEGDFVRSLYLRTLVQQATLAPDDLALALRSAQRIGSDFELAQALIRVADTQTIEGAATAPYFQAAGTIGSDFEHRRALSALLSRVTDPVVIAAMFQSAAQIGSDFEQAELLRAAAARGLPEQAPDAFFRAVDTIDSDFEHRRVLMSVLRQGGPAAETRLMFQSAERIDSDFEQAELLIAAASGGLPEQAPDAFFRAVGTIGSDFEQRRVLAAVVARPTVAADTLEAALGSASAIGSDFERAELLLAIARTHRIEGRLRDAYLIAAESIRSDYEQGRVFAELLRSERAGR